MTITVTNNYKKLFSVGLLAASIAGCGGGSGGSDSKPGNPPPESDWPEQDVSISTWSFNGGSGQSVAAAKLAGSYAVADPAGLNIEIRDVRQTLKHRIEAADIVVLLPDMNLNHDTALCGMTFTPSGRFLYLAVCDSEGGQKDDAILAYNTNTEALTVFHRLPLQAKGEGNVARVGMNYFSSTLFVGGDSAVYRIEADRNAAYEVENDGRQLAVDKVSVTGTVQDIALDIEAGNLFLQTPNSIYKLPHNSRSAQRVYQQENLTGVAFSRVFGNEEAAGLYISMDHDGKTGLLFSSKDKVRSSGQLSPVQYMLSDTPWHDFALTADGQLLFADDSAFMLSDDKDERMDFDQWTRDELAQYVDAIKGLTASHMTGNTASPEGVLHSKLMANRVYTNSMADNVGWALYLLMIADKVAPDPELEPLIELLIKRHAGLHEDGKGGVKSVDGHFVRNYFSTGMPNESKPQMQVYISMKFLPAVYKAAEMYPDNENIAEYLQYLKQVIKRSGDVIRAEQRTTWESDDFGPKRMNHFMNNETWLFGDLAAAQDPNATHNYGHYTFEREQFKYDDWLKGEEVIGADHSAFIVMGAPLILDHHFSDEAWAEHNRNYYAATQSETDSLGFPYFAAFSAGFSPNIKGGYHNDGPSNHPDDIVHFPAVLGFGQLGYSEAVVGGYLAYRDGRREIMKSAGNDSIQLLGRWSMADPTFITNGLGIADFWFGAVGLAEIIQPGVTQQFRNDFYMPQTSWSTDDTNHQVVSFNAITPRLVIGVDQSGLEVALGFQRSPYRLPTNQHFQSFVIEDPLGEWVELDDIKGRLEGLRNPSITPRFHNPYFDDGLNGWKEVSGLVSVVNTVLGRAAKLSPYNGKAAELSQAVHLPLALTGSEYKVSALVRHQAGTTGRAKVRVWWSSHVGGDIIGQVVDTQYDIDGAEAQVLVAKTLKPVNSEYLNIDYIVEGGSSDSYTFNNTALFSFGAIDSAALENGDFEDGLNGWGATAGVSVTREPGFVIEGAQSVRFDVGSNLQRLSQAFDIANDPDGTRYLVRFNVGERQLNDSKFDVEVDIHDPDNPPTDGSKVMYWWDAAGVTNHSPDEVTFAMRKRPGETRFNLKFRLTARGEQPNVGDFVIIDNVRIYKEQLFDINQCSGSVTGC